MAQQVQGARGGCGCRCVSPPPPQNKHTHHPLTEFDEGVGPGDALHLPAIQPPKLPRQLLQVLEGQLLGVGLGARQGGGGGEGAREGEERGRGRVEG
jgi:hypothetical protein